jgi:hypothetical protein
VKPTLYDQESDRHQSGAPAEAGTVSPLRAARPSHGEAAMARPAGERPDYVRAYCAAAAALSQATGRDEELAASAAAAGALVCLAALDAHGALAAALRPDPDYAEVTWTVACYQIGDLVPCAIHDFRNAAAAVRALAACPEPSHVAAELIASTDTGLRWSALVRAGERLTYHSPSPESASCASDDSANLLGVALENWTRRLASWSARAAGAEDLGSDAEATAPAPTAEEGTATTASGVLAAVLSGVESISAQLHAGEGGTEETHRRLEAIEQRLAGLELLLTTLVQSRPEEVNTPAEPSRKARANTAARAARVGAPTTGIRRRSARRATAAASGHSLDDDRPAPSTTPTTPDSTATPTAPTAPTAPTTPTTRPSGTPRPRPSRTATATDPAPATRRARTMAAAPAAPVHARVARPRVAPKDNNAATTSRPPRRDAPDTPPRPRAATTDAPVARATPPAPRPSRVTAPPRRSVAPVSRPGRPIARVAPPLVAPSKTAVLAPSDTAPPPTGKTTPARRRQAVPTARTAPVHAAPGKVRDEGSSAAAVATTTREVLASPSSSAVVAHPARQSARQPARQPARPAATKASRRS